MDIMVTAQVTNLGDYTFAHDSGLSQITFEGSVPVIGSKAFSGVTADVVTPDGDTSWSEATMLSYGGNLSWANSSAGAKANALWNEEDELSVEEETESETEETYEMETETESSLAETETEPSLVETEEELSLPETETEVSSPETGTVTPLTEGETESPLSETETESPMLETEAAQTEQADSVDLFLDSLIAEGADSGINETDDIASQEDDSNNSAGSISEEVQSLSSEDMGTLTEENLVLYEPVPETESEYL